MTDNQEQAATTEVPNTQTPPAPADERKARRASRASKGTLSFREKAVVFGFFALWCLCVYSCAGGKI